MKKKKSKQCLNEEEVGGEEDWKNGILATWR